MRDSKFRGKRVDNGEWVHGYLIGEDVIVGEIMEWDSEYFCTEFWQKVDPETVGQFIGLPDRTKTDIYEYDLCKYRNLIGVVRYSDGCFHITDGRHSAYFISSDCKEVIVIGNIHDNPELLQGGSKGE
ncbi:YopX family protein [Paenibacillus ottowii]|uniref:YopX family protein n=1 Tax=Paenibacillus ottowii TaxID=2315729 RepID=UPI00272F1266|nr:YopX family protein [Paenibacillus ottowii]MDP1513089.1 YopX family protein [Paenibacillus ottowii]